MGAGKRPRHDSTPVVTDDVRARVVGCADQGCDVGDEVLEMIRVALQRSV